MKSVIDDFKFRDQLSGAIADNVNINRIADEIKQLNNQDENFRKAVDEINKIRLFLGSPEKILGSESTKHGEIAEYLEVGIRRARQALDGKEATATFEGVGRTAPVDYLIDGTGVQSKFLNGTNNNLNAVLEHMEKYRNFGRDGTYYHIPKDEFDLIEKIRNGVNSIDGLNSKTIEAIKTKINAIENESGKTFEDVVKPGISKYAEVQKGKVHETLYNHKEQISNLNDQKKDQIIEDHQPNIGEAFKVAGISAAVGATVSLTTALYKKAKEGKIFYKGDFTLEDWNDIGIDVSKGAIVGGVSGAAIYGLTNYASMSAPFAGAIVSVTKGVGSLAIDLKNGKIDNDEFIELSMVICAEAAIVGLVTAIGQVIIPVPVLGAVLGSLAGTILVNSLGAGNIVTAKKIRQDIDNYLKMLNDSQKTTFSEITKEFEKLGDLTAAAFNYNNNMIALELSVLLAREYGVKNSILITSYEDLDSYMNSPNRTEL